MDPNEALAFARESAAAGVDLYELLGVDTMATKEEVHRAWRRQGLKYHPDKAGDRYDPALYERFAHARDVLVDEAARKAYDAARAAAAQRRLQTEQMSAERRRFKDELEAAERAQQQAGTTAAAAGGAPFAPSTQDGAPLSSEREKLREAGRRRAEARQRREQEAQEAARQREDARIAELEQRLREKEDKARRRAERKAASGGAKTDSAAPPAPASAPTTTTTPTTTAQRPASRPDAEWRKLLKKKRKADDATQPAQADGTPIQEQPLFAYTMERLRAAGEAERRRRRQQQAMSDGGDDAAAAAPQPFEPRWEEIEDPEVRKFITRVPKFASTAPARTVDVPMDTAG